MRDPFLSLDSLPQSMLLSATAKSGRTMPSIAIRTVVGAVLNDHRERHALGDSVLQAPYKQAPHRPALYIKPANTYTAHGSAVILPEMTDSIVVAGCLGVVIGSTVSRLSRHEALNAVAGYTLAADISVSHTSYYRPAIKQKCRDGFCPIGPSYVPASSLTQPALVQIDVHINGETADSVKLQDLVRDVPQLIADISAFMTLSPGDIVLVGPSHGIAEVRAGDKVSVSARTPDPLSFDLLSFECISQGEAA